MQFVCLVVVVISYVGVNYIDILNGILTSGQSVKTDRTISPLPTVSG